MSQAVADDLLRSFFQRWQRLEEEKKTISDDLKEMFAEAKAMGFDTKAMRAVFREEAGDKAAAEEFDAICDLYRASLRGPRAHPARSAREKIEKFPPHDAETGEIHETKKSDGGAVAAVTVKDQLAEANSLEPSPSDPNPQSSQSTSSPSATTAGEGAHPPFSPAPITAMTAKTKADVMRLLRPHCLHPDDLDRCGGQGTRHCSTCAKAAAESEAAA